MRVSVGLGAGDPQQRLAKFQSAASIVAPLAQASPEFQSGQYEIDIMAVWEEVFGAVGYKDGGTRFVKDNGQPKANPMMDLQTQKLQAEIQQRDRQGKGAILTGLANVAKVALGKRDSSRCGRHADGTSAAGQADRLRARPPAQSDAFGALDHGHRHGMAIADHRRNLANDAHARMQAEREAAQPQEAEPQQESAQPQEQPEAQPQDLTDLLKSGSIQFTRGPDGRISGMKSTQQK